VNLHADHFETQHLFHNGDSRTLDWIPDGSVQLVVTSPPYPMISMWDSQFASMDPLISRALQEDRTTEAFELMHSKVLVPVWKELFRVLSPGGFVCINIGDATRTIAERFRLYPNGPRVLADCHDIGFDILPQILWRKTTNAPNKFMGSGVLPAGAYVTLEHEHILILRKGGKRSFIDEDQKELRLRSSYFWEERNIWFSDMWDLGGVQQKLRKSATATLPEAGEIEISGIEPSPELVPEGPDFSARERSAAFPLELSERLILMYSLQGETVLDPFAGTFTTCAAAVGNGRSSINVEREALLVEQGIQRIGREIPELNQRVAHRLARHRAWADEWLARRPDSLGHSNRLYDIPVMSAQESSVEFFWISALAKHEAANGDPVLQAIHKPYRL